MDFENKVLTREKLVERRVNNEIGIKSQLFLGDKESESLPVAKKSDGTLLQSNVVPATKKWENSNGYNELWSRIEDKLKFFRRKIDAKVNIAQFPDDYYDLIDMLRIDITRRRSQEMDYTTELTNEITNLNFSRSVRLDEFLPFTGYFKDMTGSGDSVPLIQQKTGESGTVSMQLYGLGHQRSLEDELYNTQIFSLEKVNAAVVRAHTGLRNNLSIGQMVAYTTAGTWDASQQQGAITSGSTDEENMYLTLNSAIDLLISLNDPQTGQPIDAPRLVLACRPNDVRRINRAINGVINLYKGQPSNFAALTEIAEIWPYRGDTIYYGPDTITYSGIAENRAYLFVPGSAGAPFYTLVKRQLTQELGRGSVLELAREQRAWYFVQSYYSTEFFGATGGCASGTGFIVEIELPDATDS